MKKQNYVPTTLGQYLNENRSITLTRKYGGKDPVVVGSRAPLRNKVLSFVSENVKVSKINLKKFIAGLNETSKNPVAAANMWLKRNQKFFVTENKNGIVSYKLSKLGEKLIVILNNEEQAKLKKGKSFMPVEERKIILKAIKHIDEVFISIDKDKSVCESLKALAEKYPNNKLVFANGGDRHQEEVPETKICKEFDIEMKDNLGEKIQSSSKLTGLKEIK